MTIPLNSQLIEQYGRDGYLFPLPVFNTDEVAQAVNELNQIEQSGWATETTSISNLLRVNAHYLFPFVNRMAHNATLVDNVAKILGPNMLIYSAEFFIKEPCSENIVSWHQDLTYWGLGETDEEITAWIALSDVSIASGCMRFLPGSHRQRIQPHNDTFDKNNLLSRGQEIAVEVDEDQAVNIELKPGQVSLHHGRMFHASGPNTSKHRRIGLVIRYVTPQVEQSGARGFAMMARGIDTSGNWCHVAQPAMNFDPTNMDIYNKIRAEQVKVLMKNSEGKSVVYD